MKINKSVILMAVGLLMLSISYLMSIQSEGYDFAKGLLAAVGIGLVLMGIFRKKNNY